MKLEESTAYVKNCFQGEPASCSCACPFGLDIRALMEKVEKGRWLPAYKALRSATVFPVIVSVLCPQPCRNHCQRTSIGDEALAVRDLEAACIKYTKTRKPESFVIPPKAQRVAVIGAGPAGLSCALNMAQKKYPVTVFEKEGSWGGSLRSHPRFNEFNEDIALQFSAVEADFRYNTEIKDLSAFSDYDAVYIATGKGGEDFGLQDSWDPELLTTSDPGIFMGGGVCGSPVIEAIAQGSKVSKILEGYLQTGRAYKTPGEIDPSKCTRTLRHDDAERMPLVRPASPEEGYTQEEAKAEASRCFRCDCDYCEKSCEMLKWFRKKPHKLGIEVYGDSIANPPVTTRSLTREAYSCNICGHCKAVCPAGVDIGDLMQFSRKDRVSSGKDVPAYHDYWLREFDFHTEEAFFAAPPKSTEYGGYVFFPGCQLGAAEPDYVLKSYDYLGGKYDAGIILGCCGAPAYWAGDEKRLNANIERLKKIWLDMGKPTFVTACAYCGNIFEKFLPEINRVSLYELLAKDTELKPFRVFDEAAVFDPCAARSDGQAQESVRELSQKAGVALSELKEPNRCCGYGGHIRLANPELYDEITANRAEASGKPYIVYCANCREVFKQKGKDCAHILDLVFGLTPDRRVPSLHSKKENSLEVKKQLMKKTEGKEFAPKINAWDHLKLIISGELLDEMDKKLIVSDDLKEAVWNAEQSGEKFVDEEDGIFQCSLVKPALTYWVQYKEAGPETYEVTSAYAHRMHFSRED